VAALLRSCNPSLTPAQITATLRQTAAPVANGVPSNVGAGRVDAKAAGDAVCLPPPVGPTFNVSDASVQEGNGGFTTAKTLVFTVTLSSAATAATSVKYATANGTAVAPGDYTAKALTSLSFTKGQTAKTVSVTVKGDAVYEPDEALSLVLSSPVGAPIGDGTGVGTIVNDDVQPVVPAVSVSDATVVEGNGGFTTAKTLVFTVHLSAPAPGPVSIKYRTVDGTAVAPGDYTAKALTTLSFSKGQTSKTVTVTVKGDKVLEPDEVLFLLLSSPVGMTLADDSAVGTGTVVNDDA
jgi:chitinase